jgi:hypothetical protein
MLGAFPSPLRANGQDTTAYVRPFVKDGAYAESIRSAKEARSIKRPYMKIVHGRASPDLAAEIGGWCHWSGKEQLLALPARPCLRDPWLS